MTQAHLIIASALQGSSAKANRAAKQIALSGNQASRSKKGQNPRLIDINIKIIALSIDYSVPVRALKALFSSESDFRQFDKTGQPLISPNSNSSAAGLGQILRTTANLYGKSYQRILWDWQYNMEVSVEIYAVGYHHAWNRSITNLQLRAARAYGIYHDGFQPPSNPTLYSAHPRGYTGPSWERRYLSRY